MEHEIVELPILRFTDCRSRHVEALQGEQGSGEVSISADTLRRELPCVAIRLDRFLVLPLEAINATQSGVCAVRSGIIGGSSC